MSEEDKQGQSVSRRSFLKAASTAAGGLAAGGLTTSIIAEVNTAGLQVENEELRDKLKRAKLDLKAYEDRYIKYVAPHIPSCEIFAQFNDSTAMHSIFSLHGTTAEEFNANPELQNIAKMVAELKLSTNKGWSLTVQDVEIPDPETYQKQENTKPKPTTPPPSFGEPI